VGGVERECSLDEGGDRRGFLVVVELDIGESRVIVDDRVRVIGADPESRGASSRRHGVSGRR